MHHLSALLALQCTGQYGEFNALRGRPPTFWPAFLTRTAADPQGVERHNGDNKARLRMKEMSGTSSRCLLSLRHQHVTCRMALTSLGRSSLTSLQTSTVGLAMTLKPCFLASSYTSGITGKAPWAPVPM